MPKPAWRKPPPAPWPAGQRWPQAPWSTTPPASAALRDAQRPPYFLPQQHMRRLQTTPNLPSGWTQFLAARTLRFRQLPWTWWMPPAWPRRRQASHAWPRSPGAALPSRAPSQSLPLAAPSSGCIALRRTLTVCPLQPPWHEDALPKMPLQGILLQSRSRGPPREHYGAALHLPGGSSLVLSQPPRPPPSTLTGCLGLQWQQSGPWKIQCHPWNLAGLQSGLARTLPAPCWQTAPEASAAQPPPSEPPCPTPSSLAGRSQPPSAQQVPGQKAARGHRRLPRRAPAGPVPHLPGRKRPPCRR
mmetsp:Transcript_30515/g.86273  ORF Transcript_30515/g.86273 Transcript_30515/m.86273 type:complete len:301 (+) Transcript_30515:4026-4928(+)